MLRYIIFAGCINDGDEHEGWKSVLRKEDGRVMSFNTTEEATEKLPKTTGFDGYDWSHIVDLRTGEIVVSR
ncbi:MAG: hypothetical protein WC657_02730 [Candidatus Paceibacterota bacterium]|jgi:hypothetical protein